MGIINNFQEMLSNIFVPLFEVSIDPSSHPKLHVFLKNVVAFDSVDDESKREFFLRPSIPDPVDWTGEHSPPYALFNYYLAANIHVLNQLRSSRGLNTFGYRPHAGEVGDVEHLISSYLLATSINHGIELAKSPTLQYLFYLSQTGISMSPLSNNLLFLEYDKNPFPLFFARGLNVTLSTDDPLMIHVTKEPLVEEYSIAAQVWKLTSIDMCEAARNSVLQSGFAHRLKAHWLGPQYFKRSIAGNDTHQSNVPDIRIQYRLEMHAEEFAFLNDHLADGEVAITTGEGIWEEWQTWRTAETAECFSHALMDPL
jgi:AMP deaminase